jgi:plastocyanin domain-containing protein
MEIVMSNVASFTTRLRTIGLLLGSFMPLVAPARAAFAESAPAVREIEIEVGAAYQPAQITIKQGEKVRLKFLRKSYGGCTRELVIPALQLRKELPPNQPVVVELPPLAPGDYEFHCGMNMVRGTITVAAS